MNMNRGGLLGRFSGGRARINAAAEGDEEDPKTKKGAEGEEDDDEVGAEGEEDDKPAGKGKDAEGEEPDDDDEVGAEGEEDDKPAGKGKGAEGEEDDDKPASAGQIARYCAQNNCAHMADKLVASKVTLGQLKARVGRVGRIRDMVKTARKIDPTIGMSLADRFIKGGSSVAETGEALLGMIAGNQAPAIRSGHAPGSGKGGAGAGWDRAIAKVAGSRAAKR